MVTTRARALGASTARGVGLLAVVLAVTVVPAGIAGASHGISSSATHTPVHAATAVDAGCTSGIPVLGGSYTDSKNVSHGFVDVDGTFTTINDPKATRVANYAGTVVYSVSDGTSGGSYTVGGSYNNSKGVSQGFIEQGGKFTTIDDPSAGSAAGQGTGVWGMNDLGVVGGWFVDSRNVVHGFEDDHGMFTTLNDPSAGTKDQPGDYLEAGNLGSELFGFNDGGVIFGEYVDANGVAHGAEEVGGSYINVNDPEAGTANGEGSAINYVNNLGVIGGAYEDSKGDVHGFVDNDGTFTTINDPRSGPGTIGGTQVQAIDNEGAIVGNYFDKRSLDHGFVDIGGKFTTINDPSAGTASGQGTVVYGTPLSLCP